MIPINYISFMDFKINNHSVKVNELSKVVTITAQEEIFPSCPIFFAIIKQLLVVALPSITNIATNFSLRNPIKTAIGRNIIHQRSNLIAVTPVVCFHFSFTSQNSKDAPSPISASGDAKFPKYVIDFAKMTGCGILQTDQIIPIAIPRIIGLVAAFFAVFIQRSLPE